MATAKYKKTTTKVRVRKRKKNTIRCNICRGTGFVQLKK